MQPNEIGRVPYSNTYASVRIFSFPTELQDYYEGVIGRGLSAEKQSLLNRTNNIAEEAFRSRSAENFRTYGDPLPDNMQQCLDRKAFQRMEYFEDRYNELEPFFVGLNKLSTALIEKPKMLFTEREIGMFSLERFMMGIEPEMGFYSNKEKKYIEPTTVFFNKKNKKVIEANDVVEDEINKVKTYKYKKDGSVCERVSNIITKENGVETDYYLLGSNEKLEYRQVEEDGEKVYGTKNKKVFFTKEVIKRPFKSIRIFISCGNNWNSELINIGVAAISVAKFMESIGYSVRITAVFGFSRERIRNKQGSIVSGYRINMVDIKNYHETLYLPAALYITSDKTFFRVKYFRYLIAEQQDFDDPTDSTLGQAVGIEDLKSSIISKMKDKELPIEKNTLYYFIGGSDCETIVQAQTQIIKVVIESEVDNLRALRDIGRIKITDDELEEIKRDKMRELIEIQSRINPQILETIRNIRI